jgi:hypothetical protein
LEGTDGLERSSRKQEPNFTGKELFKDRVLPLSHRGFKLYEPLFQAFEEC